MENKIVPKEIQKPQKDTNYEYFRTIKTFCVIMIIFCFALLFKKSYIIMLQKAQSMRFYPENTVFYVDYNNSNDFKSPIKLPYNTGKISYGIFKDKNGNEKFLIVSDASANQNTDIIKSKKYYFFSANNYTFYSNSKDELSNLKTRISTHDWAFIKNKNVKKSLKKLNTNRTSTIVIRDIAYTPIPINSEITTPILDTIMIQTFKNKDSIYFNGEITSKNKIINIVLNLKYYLWNFANREIKIQRFGSEKPAIIIGLKDFDILIKTLVQITKSLDNKQYGETISLIQTIFNSDVEEDIIKQLSGSAVFYLYNDKNIVNKLLVIETKKNLTTQVQKYLNYLQLSDSISLDEKEIQKQTFNVLSSEISKYSVSFGSVNDNTFIIGDQNIVEKYIETNDIITENENCDIYAEADLNRIPFIKFSNIDFNQLKLKLNISANIVFEGELTK